MNESHDKVGEEVERARRIAKGLLAIQKRYDPILGPDRESDAYLETLSPDELEEAWGMYRKGNTFVAPGD